MKLTKDAKPIRKNYDELKLRWIIFLRQGTAGYGETFYKVIKVGVTDAVCIPLKLSNRIEAETVEEEYQIATNRSGYAATLQHISTRSEVDVFGIHLRSGEKKLNE